MRIPWRTVCLIIVMQMASCAAPSPSMHDPLEAAPADFYIDATVLAKPASRSPNAAKVIQSAPVHLRPARYVLFADGTLRHAFDTTGEKGGNWLPPITRILTREQTADVWALADQLGLTRIESSDAIVNAALLSAEPGQRVICIDFRGSGRRWMFIRAASLDEPPDAAVAKLVQRLAELSWADQQTPADAVVMPKRYDFGPDPYEQYRRSETQP